MVQWCYGRTTLNGASHPLMLGNSIADVVHNAWKKGNPQRANI